MRNIKFRSYYIYLYILLFKLYLSYGKDFYITSNSTYFDSNSDVNIDTLINNESQNEAINLYFMDDLYDFSIKFNNDINIYNDINIIGMSNNGTIFDFKNTRKGSMLINYSSKSGYKILFKNIIFQNFNSNGDEKVSLFQMTSTPVEQKIYFEDCIFQNNNCILIKMQRHNGCDINLEEEKFSTISLDNCYFYNNRELLFYIIMKEVTALALESLCQRVIINNSRFEYNDNIIRLQSGNLFINNSTFNNNYSKKNEATAQFIDSYGYKNKVIVKDSQISNIKLVDDLPLIFIKKSYMKIYNCRINNIVGSYYHMIRIKIAPTIELEKVFFENTNTVLYAINSVIILNNLIFSNYNIKNSLPLLDDGELSELYISNSNFYNIKIQGNSLMSSQIKHYLENIIIDYIKINSDSLISSFYNNYISIINVEISNIFCFGDNSSVLSLDTGIMDSIINIENLKIYSCVSNGPIIRFNGNFNNIFIKNSTLYDNTSYGSTIENISKKTNMTIDNLYVMNNININKNECGIIQLRNNCDFHLTNSIFDNNYKLKNGGALCFNKLTSGTLSIVNNKFSKNYAEKMGGAIYISYINDANNENSNIYLSNNEFKNNKVDYFGGAIYIDFNKNDNIVINNSLFYENKAGISGGAVYSPYYAIPINNSNLDINNKAISYGNFLSTLPLKIRLENNNLQSLYIQSNNYIPLNFTLYDNYGQFVNDTLRYYSDITIKVSVIYNDKSFNNQIINRNTLKKISLRNDYDSSYKISGNVGSFTNGFCHLQNFKIQTKDKMNLMLRFEVENYIDNIYFITNNISISINDCTNIQYTKKDKNNFIQCEEFNCFPKCDSVKSFCKKNYTNSYYENSPKYNICTCKEGYKGDDCDDHIYDDISNAKILINIITIISIITLITSMSIIVYNRKASVIYDMGLMNHMFLILGLLLYFISTFFISSTNWTESWLNLLYRHSGIFLIYLVFNNFINSADEFGIESKDMEIEKSIKSNSYSYFLTNSSVSRDLDSNIDTIDKIKGFKNSIFSKKLQEYSVFKSEIRAKKIYLNIRKNYSRYLMSFIYFPLFIIFLLIFIFIIVKKEDGKEIQSDNKKWQYKSPLETIDIILNILEIFIFSIIFVKSKMIINYECIFCFVKLINLSTIIIITLGPVINIISKFTLNNKLPNLYFTLILNSICYLSVFTLLYLRLIYSLLFKKEKCNNVRYYFVIPSKEFCYEHWSYLCDCDKELTPKEVDFKIRQYLKIYKFCSTVFEFRNNHLYIIKSSDKLNHLHEFI